MKSLQRNKSSCSSNSEDVIGIIFFNRALPMKAILVKKKISLVEKSDYFFIMNGFFSL